MEIQIKDLKVEVDGEEILKGLNLTVKEGEVVGLMGRNGSGKSTLAKVIFGHPDYEITNGDILGMVSLLLTWIQMKLRD